MFGAFVPGSYVAPFNPLRPTANGNPSAPPAASRITTHDLQRAHSAKQHSGRGELVPGSYPVPFNPITGMASPNLFTIGELIPGSYPMPFNPMNTMSPVGCGDCGGMGDLDLSSIGSDVSSWFSGVDTTTILMYGGAAFLLFYLLGRPNRAEYRKARSEAIAKVKRQYPRRASTAASRLAQATT